MKEVVGDKYVYLTYYVLYFNSCTVHLLLFCTMTNQCTIVHWLVIVQNKKIQKYYVQLVRI